jgi:transporter family-2 protein
MNDGSVWIYFTMLLAGLAIPVMAAMTAQVGHTVGAPTAAVGVFVTAAVAATVFAQLSGGLRLDMVGGVVIPTILGGVIIAFYLLSISMLGPRIGIGTAVLLVLAGQIASSVVIDTFGLFGAPRVPFSTLRVLGIMLVVIGVMLARRPIL